MLNDLALAVFWTKFAEEEAVLGGYTGKTAIVPLGVDLNTFYPHDREEARRREHFAEHVMNHFVVGVVGRNQPRKRLDLTVSYYAEWVHAFQIENAILLCHVAPTGDAGWDLQNLGLYYRLKNKMIINSPMDMGKGIDEDNLSWRYAAMDACVTTTQGEGWGLCTMEAMACGIPNIVPDWAALGEWCEDAALKVPCTQIAHSPGNINAQGGIADREQFIHALDKLYTDQTLRQTYRDRGLALVQRPVYRWATAGKSFRECLLKVVSSPNVKSANAG
jgi:glycosyltransferase involved in cell wall biosynthesis